jgi:hypothetical protein
MKEILKILFLIIYVKTGFAQQDYLLQKPKRNNIQIDFGFVHTRLIDEGFTQSKLLFRGTTPKISLGYGRQYSHSIINFLTSLTPGNLSTRQSGLTTSFKNVSLAIEYLRKLKTFKFQRKESWLFAGLQLSSTNYLLQNSPIFDNIDIFSLHGIYFKLNYQITLNKKQNVQFIYSIPAVVYANHVLWNSGASVYDFNDLDNIVKLLSTHGRYYYFNFWNNIQIDLLYKRKIGKHIDFTARYAFRHVNNFVETPIRFYSNELLWGLKFNF